jgi:hypothetical protein
MNEQTPKEKAIEWLHNNASNLNNIYNALGNDVKVILAISNMLDIAISSERERMKKIIEKYCTGNNNVCKNYIKLLELIDKEVKTE